MHFVPSTFDFSLILLISFQHFDAANLNQTNVIEDFIFSRIVGYGLAGCEPSIMGIGPVPAIRAMLGKTGIKLEDIDQVIYFVLGQLLLAN